MSLPEILLVALGLSCLARESLAQGVIENYGQLWMETMEEMHHTTTFLNDCEGIKFEGDTYPTLYKTNPTSANLLTPADIGVVAAIGDSITAGFGARATSIFFEPITEFRGVSWSIGGDGGDSEVCATLPNIIRKFSPDVKGASTGKGDENSENSRYNRAVSGAESLDIMAQAKRLVEQLKSELSEEAFSNEWKLVTLWIGGNDLCRSCNDWEKFSSDNYVRRISETLVYLKDNLPRTLVNVPQTLDVTEITETNGLVCGIVKWIACDCASKQDTKDLVREYQDRLNDLYGMDYLFDKEDFSFVIQPFFLGITVPRNEKGNVDMSFFAPDCFHLSVRGHKGIAAALWNNMLSKPAEKEENWVPYGPTLKSPDPAAPYFYTIKTEELLASSAGFQSQSTGNEEQSSDHGDDTGGKSRDLGKYFGAVIGSAAVGYLAVVLVIVVIGLIWRRRRQSQNQTETTPLVSI